MKNFLKMVLAVVCGLFLTAVMLFMFFGGLVSSLAPSSSSSSLPKSGVLAIDMSKISIAEQSVEPDVMTMVQGGASISTVGIWQAVSAINCRQVYLHKSGRRFRRYCHSSGIQEESGEFPFLRQTRDFLH